MVSCFVQQNKNKRVATDFRMIGKSPEQIYRSHIIQDGRLGVDRGYPVKNAKIQLRKTGLKNSKYLLQKRTPSSSAVLTLKCVAGLLKYHLSALLKN